MKKLLMCFMLIMSMEHLPARSYRRGGGFATFGVGVGLPLGGVYYADGPQGSYPYYGTPVNVGGFPAPYGYAAYAGPVVTWGW